MACEDIQAQLVSLRQSYDETRKEIDRLPALESVRQRLKLSQINAQIHDTEARLSACCEEIRAQITSLQMSYSKLKDKYKDEPKAEHVDVSRELNKINDEIVAASAKLTACLALLSPKAVAAPRRILEIVEGARPHHPECDALSADLAKLKKNCDDIENELADVEASERPGLKLKLAQVQADIQTTQTKLDACLGPQDPFFANPEFHGTSNWAESIGGGVFPVNSPQEWTQVLAPAEEYDGPAVGISGWIIDPNYSTADFPFAHPFGTDWEFAVAPDPQYTHAAVNPPQRTTLLAPSNASSDANPDSGGQYNNQIVTAASLLKDLNIGVPDGVLGVEWDSGLVPLTFQEQVHEGDRVALFGRLIVDCGHPDFHTEIHPPLLIACASVHHESDGTDTTRVLFTSRPYLVGQKYTVATSDIYIDEAADDGYFLDHMNNEVVKINEYRSNQIEAHPKIKSRPFQGAYKFRLVARPPAAPPDIAAAAPVVSFQFTVRSGCAVQVSAVGNDSVGVVISLDEASYTPPPLPTRKNRILSLDELASLDARAGKAINDAEKYSAEAQLGAGALIGAGLGALVGGFAGAGIGFAIGGVVLGGGSAINVIEKIKNGILTDEYDALPAVSIRDSAHAVTNVLAGNIVAGSGVSQNDDQPFPVYGWLDVKWARSMVAQP